MKRNAKCVTLAQAAKKRQHVPGTKLPYKEVPKNGSTVTFYSHAACGDLPYTVNVKQSHASNAIVREF